jgi:hypothetical protein
MELCCCKRDCIRQNTIQCYDEPLGLQFEQLQDMSDNLIHILGALTRPIIDLDQAKPSVRESVNQALELLKNNDA